MGVDVGGRDRSDELRRAACWFAERGMRPDRGDPCPPELDDGPLRWWVVDHLRAFQAAVATEARRLRVERGG